MWNLNGRSSSRGLDGDGSNPRGTRGGEFRGAALEPWAMLLLDVSGSMSGDKLLKAKEAVWAYVEEAFALGERVGLATFAHETQLVAAPSRDFSAAGAGLANVRATGGTDLAPALELVGSLGDGEHGLRKVVVVTDGMTQNAEAALRVAERMRNAGFFFVTRGIPQADEAFLEMLRGPQGVGSFTSIDRLSEVMRDAARLLPPAKGS